MNKIFVKVPVTGTSCLKYKKFYVVFLKDSEDYFIMQWMGYWNDHGEWTGHWNDDGRKIDHVTHYLKEIEIPSDEYIQRCMCPYLETHKLAFKRGLSEMKRYLLNNFIESK